MQKQLTSKCPISVPKLSHKKYSQYITPVKHAFSHFATLNAIDEFLRIKMFAFALVDYVKKGEKNWWLGRESNP